MCNGTSHLFEACGHIQNIYTTICADSKSSKLNTACDRLEYGGTKLGVCAACTKMDEQIAVLRKELAEKQRELEEAILKRGGKGPLALLAVPNNGLDEGGELVLSNKEKKEASKGNGGKDGVALTGLRKVHHDVLEISSTYKVLLQPLPFLNIQEYLCGLAIFLRRC